jgi:hypothetical protein
MVDPEHDLSDDLHEAAAQQEVVGLVDRARLRVLDGHHAEVRLAARDAREREPDRVARHRVGIGERGEDRALAERAGLALVRDA